MNLNECSSLVSLVARSASQFGQRPALVEARNAGQNSLTYDQLWAHVQRGATALKRFGLKRGDRVSILAEASPDWPAAFFSVLHGGMIAVPITADSPPETVAVVNRHANVSAVIHTERTKSSVGHLAGVKRLAIHDLFAGDSAGAADPSPTGSELAVLAFTSGSTRQPRGVELTHANLLADLEALLQTRHATPDDAFLSMLPPAHLFELMGGLLGPLACGARIVYPGSPLPNRLIESLKTDGITHACCVPGLLQCLYVELLDELVASGLAEAKRRGQSVSETAQRFQSVLSQAQLNQIVAGVRSRIGSSFRTLVLGGAALDPEWIPIMNRLGIDAEVGYGLTEASPIVSMGLARECPPGSVGSPLPGVDVRIDASSEILVRGPSITAGYYKDEELTETAFIDGWLRTGDCGALDNEGFLFITGRLKEAMVTAGGETIYPEEVEPYYFSPLFSEWCVAGRSGPHGNDLPTLFVVPAKPDLETQKLEEAFRNLRSSAPARMRLEAMIRLDQPIPRTPLGKPRRRAVAESLDQQTRGTNHA